MNAVTVCVGFSDVLAVTLPRNRELFAEHMVATTPDDAATQELARAHGCRLHLTNAFTSRGALFNKWLALEEALDALGREGWLCLLDCDVVLPRAMGGAWMREVEQDGFGLLYTPYRRMRPELTPCSEAAWSRYPIHRNTAEWAGYCQMFHADDPALGPPPWHDVTWRHAGGADSFFQAKWPRERRVRPPWECLHLGEPGVNWAGRGRRAELAALLQGRREGRGFADEKL